LICNHIENYNADNTFLANNTTKNKSGVLIINQDSYFHHKSLCPFSSWKASPDDKDFIVATMLDDKIGQYCLSTDEACLSPPVKKFYTAPDKVVNGEKNIVGAAQEYFVTGPDVDCDEAINFVGMMNALSYAESNGTLPLNATRLERHSRKIDDLELANSEAIDTLGVEIENLELYTSCMASMEKDAARYNSLINDMRRWIFEFVQEQSDLNMAAGFRGTMIQSPVKDDGKTSDGDESKASFRQTFCFVEGFLLLVDPEHPQIPCIERNSPEIQRLANKEAPEIVDRLQSIAKELENEEDGKDVQLEEERENCENHLWNINWLTKATMQQAFDVKLFLPTSKDVAEERRLSRVEYIDSPKGRRVPGQMWKTFGYFRDICWSNHVDNYSWLLDHSTDKNDAIHKGVYIRKVDANIRDTVTWAVMVLMEKIAAIEQAGRANL
jgi:hypothetical protein